MEFDARLLSLPDFVLSSGDPAGQNPFAAGTQAHAVWAKATAIAEQTHHAIDAKMFATPLDDAHMIAFTCAKFDAWAWRGTCVTYSEQSIRAYDDWLKRCAEAWLRHFAGTDRLQQRSRDDAQSFLAALRRELLGCVQHWRSEARRLKLEWDASGRAESTTGGSGGRPSQTPVAENTEHVGVADAHRRGARQQAEFPKRAAWLRQAMETGVLVGRRVERQLTSNRIEVLSGDHGGIARKTISRVLAGSAVKEKSLRVLAATLNVARDQIPND